MKNKTKKSKFLALILRHKPDAAYISLDNQGWVNIKDLLSGCKKAGIYLDREELENIVNTDDKQRYSIDGGRIRANQGHSIKLDIKFEEREPPDILFHGTPKTNLDIIYAQGLKKMARHHVHLSGDVDTAFKVGHRRGKAVVIDIDAKQMFLDGIKFFVSENGVWLTDYIDPKYFMRTRYAKTE